MDIKSYSTDAEIQQGTSGGNVLDFFCSGLSYFVNFSFVSSMKGWRSYVNETNVMFTDAIHLRSHIKCIDWKILGNLKSYTCPFKCDAIQQNIEQLAQVYFQVWAIEWSWHRGEKRLISWVTDIFQHSMSFDWFSNIFPHFFCIFCSQSNPKL